MGWFFGFNTKKIIPFGAGIPHRTRSLVDFIPLNDSEALLKLFQEKGDQIATVLLEPIVDIGSISATPTWLQDPRYLYTVWCLTCYR